jgi:hypothetical protein
VRVLFVGEGEHDVGRDAESPGDNFAGVVQTLARRVCPPVAEDSPARHWKTITLFPGGRSRGLSQKVKAAARRAPRVVAGAAGVAVVDRDHDEGRAATLHSACGAAHRDELPVIGGVAVNSIEAWTLGAPTALAAVLGTSVATLARAYQPARVEALYQGSDVPAKRPKDLLERLARELAGRSDGVALRVEVAQLTEPAEVERHCPEGFVPFARALRDGLR